MSRSESKTPAKFRLPRKHTEHKQSENTSSKDATSVTTPPWFATTFTRVLTTMKLFTKFVASIFFSTKNLLKNIFTKSRHIKTRSSVRSRITKRVSIIAAAVVVAAGLGIGYLFISQPDKVAAWFDYNWSYRTAYTLTNSGSAISTARKVKLEVDTQSLINAGKLQADCDDVRFTDFDGNVLEYFIDTANGDCNTASTDYFVKLSKVTTGKQNIYFYYGNPSAPATVASDFFAVDTTGEALLAYYSMDETTANTCPTASADSCDYAGTNDGTWNGDATYTASGKVNGAVTFDGTGDYIQGAESPFDFERTDSFSICSWVKQNNTIGPDHTVISKMVEGGANAGWEIVLYDTAAGDSDAFTVSLISNWGTSNAIRVQSGTNAIGTGWNHLCFTYDGTSTAAGVTMYINGSAQVNTIIHNNLSGSILNDVTMQIGARQAAHRMNGTIDDVRIYTRKLSATEISKIYNSGNTTTIPVPLTFTPSATSVQSEEKSPGPVGAWKFDEQGGDTTYDSTSQANNGSFLTSGEALSGLEQEISLLNKVYSTQSTSFAPSDNSVGLAYYDSAKYTSPNVYFEAIVKQSANHKSSNDVGSVMALDCTAVDNCKILYKDNTTGSVKLLDCDDVTCSTGTITIVDGPDCQTTNCDDAYTYGDFLDIDCISGSDCKLLYRSQTYVDIYFIDCENETCTTANRSMLDGAIGCALTGCGSRTVGYHLQLDCRAGADDCKFAYTLANNDIVFGDCDNATCSSGTVSTIDGNSGCPLTGCNSSIGNSFDISLFCLSGTDCKVTFYDDTNDNLRFIDCDNATCTTGTATILDGEAGCSLTNCSTTDSTGKYSSLYCISGTDCKIGFYNVTDGDLYFADCDNATCSTGTATLVDGGAGCALTGCATSLVWGNTISLDCSQGATDCKIGYEGGSRSSTNFADCDNATCSAGTVKILDGYTGCVISGCNTSASTGTATNIFCFSSTDCRVIYRDSSPDDINLIDCNSATCDTGDLDVIDGDGPLENEIGDYMDIDCSNGPDDCKLAYYDEVDATLFFFDCDDVSCTTGTLVNLDGAPYCVLTGCNSSVDAGKYVSIDCSNGSDDCKLTYFRDGSDDDLYFVDCNSTTCNVGTTTLVDGNVGCTLTGCVTNASMGGYGTLDCSFGSNDCKLVYKNGTADDLIFADCDDSACTAGTTTKLDGGSGCVLTGCITTSDLGGAIDMDCVSATDCKITYYDSTQSAIRFADCDTATCSSGTATLLDGYTGCTSTGCVEGNNSGSSPSISCVGGTSDCKISYTATGSDLYFLDCDNATCSSSTTRVIDGAVSCGITNCDSTNTDYPTMSCEAGATDCKITYSRSNDAYFLDCDDATCSTGTTRAINGVSGCNLTGCLTGSSAFYLKHLIDCKNGSSDCRVVNLEYLDGDIHIANCDDATCSTGTNTIKEGIDNSWVQLVKSDGTAIANALLTVNSSSYARLRTQAISPTTGTNYAIRAATTDNQNMSVDVLASRLIIDQNGTPTNTVTQVEVGNSETSTATSYTQLTNKKIYRFDQTKFTPTPTTYFEATLSNSTAGQTTYAALYTDGASCSSQVSGSEVSVTGTTWTRVRSNAITLTDDTDYTVCIKTTANTAQIANARVILEQNTSISAVEVIKNLVNTGKTDADTTYTSQTGLNYFDPSNFAGTTNYYFEADLKTSAGTGYAQLYNASDSAAIASSEVSTGNTSFSRERSSTLTMPEVAKTLDAQIKNSATNTTTVSSADLIIQSGTPPASSPIRRTAEACYSENCIEFNGVDNAIGITNNNSIDFDRGLAAGITFSAWVKVSSDGEADVGQIFNKGNNTYLRTTNQGSDNYVDLEASIDLASSDATVAVTNALPLNEWHHVAISYSDDGDDEVSLYVDGKLRGTSTNGSGAPAGSDANDLVLGGTDEANFHGLLDEVRLYPYGRTTAEIQTDYTAKGSTEGVTAQIGGARNQALSQGLVGFYPMDETTANSCTSGGDSCDQSGLQNDANWQGDATATPSGKYGSAVNLDGTGDYMTVADADTLDLTNNWSISGWIYNTNANLNHAWQYIVMKGTGYGQQHIPFYIRTGYGQLSAGMITNYTEDADSATISSLTNINTWMHFVAVFDNEANTMTIYINGQKQTVAASTQQPTANSTNVGIGAKANGAEAFKGKIDDMRLYNRALSPTEAQALYTQAPAAVVHWKFDENTGTTAVDSGSNDITGTLTNSPNWVAGKLGAALDLSPSSSHVLIPHNSALNITDDITITAWVKPGTLDSSVRMILGKGNASSSTTRQYSLRINASNQWQAFMYSGSTVYSAADTVTTLSTSRWDHIAVVRDRSTGSMRFYTNGVLTGSASNVTGALNATSLDLAIGKEGTTNSNYFGGSVDDVKIYNYVRSEAQILEDMTAGPPSSAGLQEPITKLSFEQGYGTTAQDSTEHNNDGTLTNMAAPATTTSGWTQNGKFGKAVSFDGSNDQISVAGTYPTSTSARTVCGWVKSADTSFQGNADHVINYGTAANGQAFGMMIYTGNTWWFYGHGGSYDINTNITVDTNWHHHCVTYDGTTVRYYYDTRLAASAARALTTSSGNFKIGISPNAAVGNEFNGQVDEVTVYNYALSQTQINEEFNQGKAAVFGSTSTASNGTTPDNTAARSYCIPGDTSTCNPPVAEWKFDENTGTSVVDSSGNNNTGTFNDSPIWTPGKLGSALKFDGSNDYVNVGNVSFNDATFTVSSWMRVQSIGESYTQIIGTWDGGGSDIAWGLGYYWASTCPVDDRSLYFQLYRNGNRKVFVTPADSFNLNQWHYVTVTRTSDTTAKIYVDGVEQTLSTCFNESGLDVVPSTEVTTIGARTATNGRMNGSVDQVRIYDYIRTPAQIMWEYNQGAPLAHYKFDECQGTTAYNSALNANGEAAGNNGSITIGASGSNTSAGTCNGSSGEAWKDGSSGKLNASLELDGTNDYVSIADADVFSFTNNSGTDRPFTLAAWVNTSQLDGGIFDKGVSSNDDREYSFLIEPTNDVLYIALYSDAGSNRIGRRASTVFPTNQWVHVVATYDGSKSSTGLRLYQNGQRVDTTNDNGGSYVGMSNFSSPLKIGTGFTGGSEYFNGKIDDARVYNYALTETQIKELYNGGAVTFN